MGYFVKPVQKYRIRFLGRGGEAPEDLRARLYLYGPDPGNPVVGAIGFYPPDVLPSRHDQLDGLGRPDGNMSITDVVGVMDMLRNDKPVYVHWSETWQQVWLDTSKEPVGEEES